MKTFLLAAAVAAGLVCSTSTADAQFRYRSGPSVYIAPSYNSYPYGYVAPSYYSGGVVTSSYVVPSYYGGVVTSNYVAPSYYVPQSYYVAPVYPSMGYSSYYGSSYYGYGGGYRGYRW